MICPVPATDGAPAVRIASRYSLAVFPFLDGVPGRWGEPIGDDDRSRLLHMLAELHGVEPVSLGRVATTPIELLWRAELEEILADVNRPWTAGPHSAEARQALAAHLADIRGWVARWEALASGVASGAAPSVVTHGEPHPGNLIRASDRLLLIDWDTVGLAPPERDLWMLDDGSPGRFAAYTAATGHPVDPAAIAVFRLTWTLADISGGAAMFRAEHTTDPETESRWRGFLDTLSTGATAPYGRR